MIRIEIHAHLGNGAEMEVLVDQIVHMNTGERFTAIGCFLDLLKSTTPRLAQLERVDVVDGIFKHEDSGSSDAGDPHRRYIRILTCRITW